MKLRVTMQSFKDGTLMKSTCVLKDFLENTLMVMITRREPMRTENDSCRLIQIFLTIVMRGITTRLPSSEMEARYSRAPST